LELNLDKLSSVELKNLSKVVETERKRRGRRSPDNHEPTKWAIPKKALNGQEPAK
jgi:hypothetical protein